MAPIYTIQLYTSAGAAVGNVTGFISVDVSRVLNAFDLAQIVLTSDNYYFASFTYGAIVEVYRQDPALGIPVTREFAGFVVDTVTEIAPITTRKIIAAGMEWLLQNRVIAWYAGVANRSTFSAQPAETVLKTLFNYNLGSLATTANGRFLSGVLTGATTAATTGAGNSITISVAGENLLSAMQKVQELAGGDFAVIYTAPATFTFTWYTGQRGTDRTASVQFSVEKGSIGRLRITEPRLKDGTTAIVAGAGTESARQIVTRPAVLPTGIDSREIWVDARNGQTTTAALQNIGTAELGAFTRGRVTYDADIVQIPSALYGVHYFIGDLVSVYTGTTTVSQKIYGVKLGIDSNGREIVRIELNAV
jgi:hypothetical protein